MVKQRKKYDKEFKERAVELSKNRKNVSELARELGIKPSGGEGVRSWKLSGKW